MEITCVAPLVGAWIETPVRSRNIYYGPSLPSWERGLKPQYLYIVRIGMESLPSWERGLKRMSSYQLVIRFLSLPSWERGLKPVIRVLQFGLRDSRPPSRTGGLKPSGWGKWGSSLTIILKEEVRKKSCKRNSRITRHTVSVHLL